MSNDFDIPEILFFIKYWIRKYFMETVRALPLIIIATFGGISKKVMSAMRGKNITRKRFIYGMFISYNAALLAYILAMAYYPEINRYLLAGILWVSAHCGTGLIAKIPEIVQILFNKWIKKKYNIDEKAAVDDDNTTDS